MLFLWACIIETEPLLLDPIFLQVKTMHKSNNYSFVVKGVILTLILLLSVLWQSLNSSAAAAKDVLRLALLPIPESLPIHLGMENGYFSELGLEIEIIPVGSAVERDQLMQAARIDGMINEVHGAALFNRSNPQMQIISTTRSTARAVPMFRILAAPGTTITEEEDLKGVAIGVSKNTIIDYVTERVLQKSGLQGGDIVTRSVPVLPERMQLLLSGQLKAATLPDPLGFAALAAGATEVANDREIGLNGIVLSFSLAAINEKGEAVMKFMRAWKRAAGEINKNPEQYRDLMLKKIRVPKNVQNTYPIPPLSEGEPVPQDQWDDAIDWLLEKELLKSRVPYESSSTDKFISP